MDNENNIDINQYIQYDDEQDKIVYFDKTKFLEDALEYLQDEHQDYEIVEV